MKKQAYFKTFLQKSNEKWNNKYDYSKVEYINSMTKVCIICPEHGEFWITPKQHLQGHGCTLCAKNGKWTTEKFINQAKQTHGNKYDYSKTEYISAHKKVCIICPEHGEFWQSATAHIRGQRCPKCNKKKTKLLLDEWNVELTNKFINECNEKWNNKYDYSKVRLNTYNDNINIICPEHGEFWQSAQRHKQSGCPQCPKSSIHKISFDEFIERANKIHGNKFTYVRDSYTAYLKHMTVICPEHGKFKQTPISHIAGAGCPQCAKEIIKSKNALSTDEFINRAKVIHNNKYDYSKVNYINFETKITIICPIHGEFKQTPNTHLNAKGCPKCKSSKLELKIISLLNDNNINYEYQCKPLFLKKYNPHYHFDFYIPQHNIVIECQGEQHFVPVDFSGKNFDKAKYLFNQTIQRDKIKYKLCKENNIHLLYFTKEKNVPEEYIGEIYTNEEDLINRIKNLITQSNETRNI